MEPPCAPFRQSTAHTAEAPNRPASSVFHHRRWSVFLIVVLSVIAVSSAPFSHDGLPSVLAPQSRLCGLQLAHAQVIGMDLGSEYVKVALVAAGRPMEIILNPASKRKTSHAVSFADAEKRDMGDEGAAAASKKPDHVFMHSNLFLGMSATDVDSTFSVSSAKNACEKEAGSSEKCSEESGSRFLPLKLQAEQSLLQEVGYPHAYYPYRLYADKERHTVAFLAREGMYLSAEMVTANYLAYLRKMAAQTANVPPTTPIGVVITVPCRFSQRQRQALRDAAEIAGMRPIALVHHAAAAATQHALDTPLPSPGTAGKAPAGSTTNDTSTESKSGSPDAAAAGSGAASPLQPSTKLFVDVGSAAVDFSLVRFEPVPVSFTKKGKDAASGPLTLSAQMLSCETLYGIGGHNVDIGLAELMREAFQKRYPAHGDLVKNPRALKKLLRQAVLSKHILSANKKTQFSVEGLLTTESGAELDLHELVDRSHVESVLERMQLRARMQQALQKTLQQAAVEMKDIDQIELLGGGWRVPHVQQELTAVLEGRSPGMHLNGDEAMATGAAFIAANSTVTFRVKKYYLTDITPYEYSLKITYRPSAGASGTADEAATEPAAAGGGGIEEQQQQQSSDEEEKDEASKQQEDAAHKETPEITEKVVTLYARNSKFGGAASSKTVSVRTADDLTVQLLEDSTILETVTVRGVAEAVAKQRASAALAVQEAEQQKGTAAAGGSSSSRVVDKKVIGDPKVSLVFTVDSTGVLAFDRAFASFTLEISEEVSVPSTPPTEKTAASGAAAPTNASQAGAAGDAPAAEEGAKKEDKDSSSSSSSSGESGTEAGAEKEEKSKEEEAKQEGEQQKQQDVTTTITKKKKQVVEPLTGETVLGLPLPLTQEEKQQLRQQLADLEAADLQVHLLSEAINRLETLIYATRGALDEDAIVEVMKGEDVEKLRQQLQDDEDYLYSKAKQEGLEAVQKRQELLEAVVVPMRKRAAERTARPGVVKAMEEGLAAAASRLQRIAELQQQHKNWPPQEKIKKAQQVNETLVSWWKEKYGEQEKRESWEEPVFTSVEVRKKMRELEAALVAVEEAPKPTPPAGSGTAGGKKSAAAAARKKRAAREAKAAADAQKGDTPAAEAAGDAAGEAEQQQQQEHDDVTGTEEGQEGETAREGGAAEEAADKNTDEKQEQQEEGAAGKQEEEQTAGQREEKIPEKHDEL